MKNKILSTNEEQNSPYPLSFFVTFITLLTFYEVKLCFNWNRCTTVFYTLDQFGGAAYVNIRIPWCWRPWSAGNTQRGSSASVVFNFLVREWVIYIGWVWRHARCINISWLSFKRRNTKCRTSEWVEFYRFSLPYVFIECWGLRLRLPFATIRPQIEWVNPSNAKLNPICHLLALLGAHHILHVNGLTVKSS